MNSTLSLYISERLKEFDLIPAERKQNLQEMAEFVNLEAGSNRIARLIFICTHNSRRSHFGQIWAKTAAWYYGITEVETYSGGTEATAFNPRAVEALGNSGFEIEKTSGVDNPVYKFFYENDSPPIQAWSKKYDSDDNPGEDFCAVMTCSQADADCPFIPGASLRISLPYEDPKNYDGTDRESIAYAERCGQIAREMFYLFSLVKK
ncbi:MAG: protein-tyrosine-phosphatase [Cyclobacteriaceae bacterium]|nr:protein-tyrosine-phosphatase [Cyclobacteriaceae bacterium]